MTNNQFESSTSTRANFDYTIYLIRSEEIEGQNATDFVFEEEKLKTEFESLQSKYDTLQEVMKGLKIEMDEEGEFEETKNKPMSFSEGL